MKTYLIFSNGKTFYINGNSIEITRDCIVIYDEDSNIIAVAKDALVIDTESIDEEAAKNNSFQFSVG